MLLDAAGLVEVAPAALLRILGPCFNRSGKVARQALDDTSPRLRGPVGRDGREFFVIARNLSPAVALVVPHRPINHGDRSEMQMLAHRETIERPLQLRAVMHELLYALRLAAFVIDDDAVVAEPVDAVDAAVDGDAAGKIERQPNFGCGRIGVPKLIRAHLPGNLAEDDALHLEAIAGRQVILAAAFGETSSNTSTKSPMLFRSQRSSGRAGWSR